MNKKHSTNRCITIAILGILFLLACTGESQTATATIILSSDTPCPEATWVPPVEQPSMFYFFLIDGSLKYFHDQHVNDARSILELALPNLVHSGDRVVLGWINNDTAFYGIENTIFYNDVFVVDTKDVSPTPTFPPTLEARSTATITPTSIGQLRATEIAKTVDAAKQIEQEAIQKSINQYLCQAGKTVAERDEINQIVETLHANSAKNFTQIISGSFPPGEEVEAEDSNPLFESVAEATNFMNTECKLSIYNNCALVIFSDLEDYRQNIPSDEVPPSQMNRNIDVVSIIYDCQFESGCTVKITTWAEHFSYFNARSFNWVLNKDADKSFYNETVAIEFIEVIKNLSKQ